MAQTADTLHGAQRIRPARTARTARAEASGRHARTTPPRPAAQAAAWWWRLAEVLVPRLAEGERPQRGFWVV